MSANTIPDLSLANVTSEIEERRCNLIGRHRDLRSKVATMERSIPALMAYNMWMAERDRPDLPYDKLRDIMNKFSPQPDPADKLLTELRNAVDGLQQETAQLHDKIIDADVKLEETGMELESLELANKEMEKKLIRLRNEVQKHGTLSLHSIHSEDLICLKKIRQLAEEELKLKNCVKELEGKEVMYRRQMSKLLSCKKFQRDNGKMTERVHESGENSKELYRPLEDRKSNIYVTQKKYALKDKEQRICCSCAMSITLTGYEKTWRKSSKACEKLCPPLSCCIPLDSRAATNKSHDGGACCKSCQQISTAIFKSPCSTYPPCKSLLNTSKTDIPRSIKQFTQSSVPCDLGKTCDVCEIPAGCKKINSCKYDYEEKCARELSNALCRCNVIPLQKTSTISKIVHLGSEADDSNSDEDFCECCSCGCEDSGNSS